VPKSGGQGSGEMVHGAKPLGKGLGGKAPTVKEKIPVRTRRGGITWGVPSGCSPEKWPGSVGGEAPRW
jgi:hypothetical protein